METPNQPTDDATPAKGTGQPKNEDRVRFLQAFGLSWCTAGNHATPGAYDYGNLGSWCSEHPCPAGPTEGPIPGYCDVGRIHFAKDGVYWMPRFEKWACLRHLRTILRDAINRGSWGK